MGDTYWWCQTKDTVTIGITVTKDIDPKLLEVSLNKQRMKVGLKGAEPVIQGVPTGVVDIARCNWQLESDMLVVHLRKTTPGQWTDFIDDCKPEVEGKHHGLGVAQYHIGRNYEQGLNGLTKDINMSVIHYESASKLGNLSAILRVAAIYHIGRKMFPLDSDLSLAFKYHLIAAEEHDSADGNYHVANAYHNGDGVEKSLVNAVKYYQKVVESKKAEDKDQVAHALFNLGLLFNEGGEGITQNLTKAKTYWEAAAALNYPQAVYNLGVLSLNGEGDGDKADIIKAYLYFRKASGLSKQLQIPPGFENLEAQFKIAAEQNNMNMEQFIAAMEMEAFAPPQQQQQMMMMQEPSVKIEPMKEGESAELDQFWTYASIAVGVAVVAAAGLAFFRR